jgi:energy-coupling factor transporter ATP-binding protein EcfA2
MQVQIETMNLENYKQFVGKNQIEFSTDAKRNITLIRGSNGSGKTNLVGAMRWCLDGPEPTSPRWLREGSLLISWQKTGKEAQPDKILNVTGKILLRHGRKKLCAKRVANYKHLGNQPILNKTSANVSELNPNKTVRHASQGVHASDSVSSQCAIMCQYFSQWDDGRDFQLLRRRNDIRSAALHLVSEIELIQKLPQIAKACTKIFRAIVGSYSRYYSSAVEIGPTYDLKLLESGQNVVNYLSVPELEALSFAFLLSVVKVSDRRFPIILDSPFDRLSPYRNNIAKVLGSLKQQVIILAHDTELVGVHGLSHKIGKEYVIKMDMKNGASRIMPKEILRANPARRLGDVRIGNKKNDSGGRGQIIRL